MAVAYGILPQLTCTHSSLLREWDGRDVRLYVCSIRLALINRTVDASVSLACHFCSPALTCLWRAAFYRPFPTWPDQEFFSFFLILLLLQRVIKLKLLSIFFLGLFYFFFKTNHWCFLFLLPASFSRLPIRFLMCPLDEWHQRTAVYTNADREALYWNSRSKHPVSREIRIPNSLFCFVHVTVQFSG